MDGISVIVAVRNEEAHIERCLDSLLDQSMDCEIIVVDGDSTDNTVSIVKKYQETGPEKIKLFHNPQKRQVFGRDIGIKHAEGDYIAYIDGHSYAKENWLETLYTTLQHRERTVAGVGSVHRSPKSQNFVQRAIDAVFNSYVGGFKSSYRFGSEVTEVVTAPFVMYRREALEEVGLYDEGMRYGEDFDLHYRLRKQGYTMLIQPKAVTYYMKRRTIQEFIHQMYKYGKGRAYILKKHPDSFKMFYLSPVVFSLGFLLPLFSFLSSSVWYLFFSYYGVMTMIFLLSSLHTALKEKKILFLFCTVLYILEYFFYGIGLVYNYLTVKL